MAKIKVNLEMLVDGTKYHIVNLSHAECERRYGRNVSWATDGFFVAVVDQYGRYSKSCALVSGRRVIVDCGRRCIAMPYVDACKYMAESIAPGVC